VFVGFSHTFLLGILIFKGLTVQRLYKSFDIKGLMLNEVNCFCGVWNEHLLQAVKPLDYIMPPEVESN
jgi:hypothetical protein